MSQIKSYVPEAFFLEQKDREHMQIFHETFALVDPANGYRVMAGRGKGIRADLPFAPLDDLLRSERDFLERSLASSPHVLLQSGDRAILVFGDLLPASGLLLVLCPTHGASSLRRALLLLQKNDFVCSSAQEKESTTPRQSDAAVYEYLRGIFYDLDRILSPSDSLGIWTRIALIANFAGCAVDVQALPVKAVSITSSEALRLSAFLLCLFLSIRAEATAVSAAGEDAATELSLRVTLGDARAHEASKPELPFLRLPAFRELSLLQRDGDWVLEASFCKKSDKLLMRSEPLSAHILQLVFHVAG